MPGGIIPGLAIPAEGAVVSVRPEDVRLVDCSERVDPRSRHFVRDLGASVEAYVACGDREIVAVAPSREHLDVRENDEVGVLDPTGKLRGPEAMKRRRDSLGDIASRALSGAHA